MKILKASAGSGKTYRLSHTYLDLLLKDWASNPYRHILAVTFTNKATGEMKARILRDLAELAKKDPRAKTLLTALLHDYGAFAISTIDRFFQQALKAFSREIGQYADYQVELDKDSLIAEAMDRILDSLTEDSGELLDWIRESLSDTLEQGRRYRVDEGLLEIGRLLKNDEFRELAEREGLSGKEAFGKERLKRIRESCRAVIRDFCARAEAMALPVTPGELIKMPGKRALKASPELAELFDEPYRIYCTAFILDGLLFQLGLAGEFYREFDALATEKNVLCLDESNTILRDIINGSDAPFVYEKLGVRFEHFLLDEFQDTSHIQWENFLPLLQESEGKTKEGSLIVGDVKQSIYRFRDSDWELLGSEVEQQFPGAEVETMQENWRSSRAVVGFNARFFRYAAGLLGLEDIYTGLDQLVKREDVQEGAVRVDFCEDQTAAILASIEAVRRNGAQWSDIAVLVRNRKEGASVASSLIGCGIPVISDDSLQLKGSPVVRRLVSLLSCYENPDDRIGRFLADSMNLSFPQEYHSLVDFCEELLRAMQAWDPASFDGQVLFIQAFMDDLQSWVQVNGNNLRYYLKHWEENEFYIGSPENAASVRVLTIHKSKGLEFPHVIFPFADKVDLYKHGVHWCRLETAGTPLGPEVAGIYPVDLGSLAENSLFADAVRRERRLQLVDNINLFYVALTRAKKSLHVIAKLPSKKCRESVAKGAPECGNFSEILFAFLGGQEVYEAGKPYDFSRLEREAGSGEEDFPAAYPSFALDGRLAPSQDAHDFFHDDGSAGVEASPRLRGIVLHDILSQVRTPDELDAAVDAAVRDGKLTASGGEQARTLLRRGMAAHADWFPAAVGEDVQVINEQDIFGEDGSVERPDRVVVRGREVTIIDYKFGGEEERYRYQLRRYAKRYRDLGYTVSGCWIWYVEEDKPVSVT